MTVKSSRPTSKVSLLVLSILALIWLLPTIGLLITSVRERTEAQRTGWWDVILNPLSQKWELGSYASVLSESDLGRSFISSLAVTIPAPILPLLFAAYAAYGFTFLTFKGREFYFALIIGLLVVPLQGALVPVLKMFISFTETTGIEISGQYAAAWFVHSAFAMPLAIYILRNYMMTIPNSLIEAARVDGGSDFTMYRYVAAPLLKPGIATVAVFTALGTWNEFLLAMIYIQNESYKTIPVGLLTFSTRYSTDYQMLFAALTVITIPMIIIYIAFNRQIVAGLTEGSLK